MKLKEILQYTEKHAPKGKQFKYIIEVKNLSLLGMQAADKLVALLKELNMLERVAIGCFMPDVGYYIAYKYPEAPRGASIPEALQFYYYARAGLDLSKANIKYSVLQLPYGESIGYLLNTGTRAMINYGHANNLAMQYWTINSKDDMQYLIDNNADAIMTDFPQLMQ